MRTNYLARTWGAYAPKPYDVVGYSDRTLGDLYCPECLDFDELQGDEFAPIFRDQLSEYYLTSEGVDFGECFRCNVVI